MSTCLTPVSRQIQTPWKHLTKRMSYIVQTDEVKKTRRYGRVQNVSRQVQTVDINPDIVETFQTVSRQEQTLQRKFRQSRDKFRIKVNNKDKSGKFADKF